jgi:arginase
VSIIYVPYHLEEHLPDLNAPLPEDLAVTEVSARLRPEDDVWARLCVIYEAVADAVASQARARAGTGSMVPVVSGDCTMAIGVAAGLQRAGIDPAIVWFDAHGDVQTMETTSSGYLGGMAVRFLLGYRADLIAGPLGLRPPSEERVVLVDARDLDPPEVDYLATARVKRLPVGELTPGDLPDGPLLVNLDVDVIDPEDLPGLRYPASGGPALDSVVRAARTVMETGRVAALNIACTWHPGRPDSDGVRERLLSTLLDPEYHSSS